jgi:preprotein translocase subunit SecE
VSKKDNDKMTGTNDDPSIVPLPEPPPARISSSGITAGAAAPRAARFGEGKEGRAVRRERGIEGPRTNFFDRAGQFLRDVRAEMTRVAWPTANEVKNTTVITIIAVIFFAIYLFAVDRGLTFLITQLERFVSWLLGGI